jgi:hypothetical protein
MIPRSGNRLSPACRLRRFTLSYCGECNDEPRPGPEHFGSLPGFGAATEPVVAGPFWSRRASSGAVAGRTGATTTTSRFAPVLPSTIVTVTALVVFVGGAGDTIPAAAGSAESVGAAACGTDTSSGAFFAMRRSAGATATGSERHRDDLRCRDVDHAPAVPWTLPERRCEIIRSHPASRPSSREQTILLRPTASPHAMRRNFAAWRITRASIPRRPFTPPNVADLSSVEPKVGGIVQARHRHEQKNRGGTRPPRL